VGACSELLLGVGPDDKALGAGGIVTAMGNPAETASALIHLLRDPALRAEMAAAGIRRTERFYAEEDMLARYREIYRRHMERP
jgi:glycosyltransferase involved in cell wall biosynthesis